MTSRALLVKIKRDLENQIRGQSRSLTRTSLNHPVCMIGVMRPHRYGRSYRRELGIQIDRNYRFQSAMNEWAARARLPGAVARTTKQAGVSSTDQAAGSGERALWDGCICDSGHDLSRWLPSGRLRLGSPLCIARA
jgi:hypothetical protein